MSDSVQSKRPGTRVMSRAGRQERSRLESRASRRGAARPARANTATARASRSAGGALAQSGVFIESATPGAPTTVRTSSTDSGSLSKGTALGWVRGWDGSRAPLVAWRRRAGQEALQLVAKSFEVINDPGQRLDELREMVLHGTTERCAVVAERERRPDLAESETSGLRRTDEDKAVDRVRPVVAESTRRPAGSTKEPDVLVVTDRLGTDRHVSRQLSDPHTTLRRIDGRASPYRKVKTLVSEQRSGSL